MEKPLWRWTCGGCTSQGIDILKESIFRTMRAIGENNWDWMICYNGLLPSVVIDLEEYVRGFPITLHEQSWNDCPIDDHPWSPIKEDGSIEINGDHCGGTLWKVCPPRMRPDAHEVIMDNDLIFMKKLPIIDTFLKANKTLILEEPIRYYGRFDYLVPKGQKINSGLMGLPPGFDFGERIKTAWQKHGKVKKISQADEQGLLMYVLQAYPNLRISKEEVRQFGAFDPLRMLGNEDSYHFVQANRTTNHKAWSRYNQIYKEEIPWI